MERKHYVSSRKPKAPIVHAKNGPDSGDKGI